MKKIFAFIISIAIAISFSGCESEPDYLYLPCDECGSEVPEHYLLTDALGNDLCAMCFQWEMQHGDTLLCPVCKELYLDDWSDFFGYCQNCGEDRYVPCTYCDEYTEKWHTDFSLCTRCARGISWDEKARSILRRLFDGEY